LRIEIANFGLRSANFFQSQWQPFTSAGPKSEIE